jgi:hypothetical protein
MAIKFGELWKHLGAVAQMTGGVMIGTMNKPGKDGVRRSKQIGFDGYSDGSKRY